MDNNETELDITCKEAHRLVSEGLDRDLSPTEQSELRLHLIICIACTSVNNHMNFIRSAMRRLPLGEDVGPDKQSA
jgi:hypothetical protein